MYIYIHVSLNYRDIAWRFLGSLIIIECTCTKMAVTPPSDVILWDHHCICSLSLKHHYEARDCTFLKKRMTGMCEALGLTPSPGKKEKREKEE